MRIIRYLSIAVACVIMSLSSCKCRDSSPPGIDEKPNANLDAKPPAMATAKTSPTKQPLPTPEEAAEKPVLPSDFPKEIPVFEGATVERVQPLANEAHNVIFLSEKPVGEITNFYRKQLESGGWKQTQNSERPNHSFIAFKKGKMIANIQIVEDSRYPGKRLIAIMYETEKELPFEEF